MWKYGDVIVWRAIYRNRIWNALTVHVVKDTPEELVMSLLPGAECMSEIDYAKGKKNGKRRWDFKNEFWNLEKHSWRTNRLLLLLESERYYSTMYFWNHGTSEFLCYYINFQVPFQRSQCGIDTLDLDLDLIIHPDFSYEWKDAEDYQKAIENEIILPEWIQGIDQAKWEIFEKLEKRLYPYDGSWLNWIPDPTWSPPTLPENWDKI